MRNPSILQTPVTVPLHSPNGRQQSAVRAVQMGLWKNLLSLHMAEVNCSTTTAPFARLNLRKRGGQAVLVLWNRHPNSDKGRVVLLTGGLLGEPRRTGRHQTAMKLSTGVICGGATAHQSLCLLSGCVVTSYNWESCLEDLTSIMLNSRMVSWTIIADSDWINIGRPQKTFWKSNPMLLTALWLPMA